MKTNFVSSEDLSFELPPDYFLNNLANICNADCSGAVACHLDLCFVTEAFYLLARGSVVEETALCKVTSHPRGQSLSNNWPHVYVCVGGRRGRGFSLFA